MQSNTSPAAHFPRFPWAYHCSCLSAAYYTTFPFYTFYMFYTAKTSTCSTRFMANHLSTTSQCPPLSGPTRRNIPSLFSFAIARATVLLSTPIISAISCVPTDGFARMAARIFCGVFCSVFCGVFCVLFREPFCALPPPIGYSLRSPNDNAETAGVLNTMGSDPMVKESLAFDILSSL